MTQLLVTCPFGSPVLGPAASVVSVGRILGMLLVLMMVSEFVLVLLMLIVS